MTDWTIQPMTADERKYAYRQSQQISMQTGFVGYLTAVLDENGDGFYTHWEGFNDSLKTDQFKAEFDEVLNDLRSDGCGLLKNRRTMADWGYQNPESAFQGNFAKEYGFRVCTNEYTYLLRCVPQVGDNNLYCFCYKSGWLNDHMKKAERGIRFITPNYKELFRVKDGDMVRITTAAGEYRDRTVRYIDDYHMELDSGVGANLYHICEFAEHYEQSGCKDIIPLRASLPEQCYSTLKDTGEIIIIKKGESGYYKADIPCADPKQARELVDEYNGKLGVSKGQEQAMAAGSMFGWRVPAADPKNYDETGKVIKPKGRER